MEEVTPSLADVNLPERSATVTTSVETSLTSRASSADDSTRPTTPLSAVPHSEQSSQVLKDVKTPSRAPGLSLPIVPAIPNVSFIPKAAKKASAGSISQPRKSLEPSSGDVLSGPLEQSPEGLVQESPNEQVSDNATPPPQKTAPKSWADLVRATVEPKHPRNSEEAEGDDTTQANGFTAMKTDSLFNALSSYQADDLKADTRISFLEPRGLVNTGNMCYMNSVSYLTHCEPAPAEADSGQQILQILLFCTPFYNFLDRVGQRVVHNFKSETPLMDAM